MNNYGNSMEKFDSDDEMKGLNFSIKWFIKMINSNIVVEKWVKYNR